MIVIGLTGGMGSGKSTVARFLAELGAFHIDGDRVAHEVYHKGSPGWQAVVAEFGSGVLDGAGEVDRRRLAAVVFGDATALARLNALVHPLTRRLVERRLDHLRQGSVAVAVVEAPLLIEAGWVDMVDEVWVVVAPEEVAVERLTRERGVAEAEARARIRSQLSNEERKGHADVVIDNAGSREQLREAVRREWEALRGRIVMGRHSDAGPGQ